MSRACDPIKALGPKKVTLVFHPLRTTPRTHTVSGMSITEKKKAPNLHSGAHRNDGGHGGHRPKEQKEQSRMHFPKIAALVKRTRAEQGVSLRELAEKTKLSHQQILRVERGICSVESALAVLKALDVP